MCSEETFGNFPAEIQKEVENSNVDFERKSSNENLRTVSLFETESFGERLKQRIAGPHCSNNGLVTVSSLANLQ